MTSGIIGQAGGALSVTSEGAANRSWLASESISSLLSTREVTTLALELAHAHSWELSGSVVLSLVLVDLVDGNDAVNNAWLNGLFMYDGLDVLMYMVVDVLTSYG